MYPRKQINHAFQMLGSHKLGVFNRYILWLFYHVGLRIGIDFDLLMKTETESIYWKKESILNMHSLQNAVMVDILCMFIMYNFIL